VLRLIIVDDEKIIRETVHRIIDWKEIGIEVIGVCKNGIEAYDMILDHYPDIVLTDIKMPGLSGLELIEKVTNADHNVEFVLLSGYGEFEYAQNAMQYGVKHYLLKPCCQEQIIEVIKSVKDDCYEKRAINSIKDEQQILSANFVNNIIKNLLYEYLTGHAKLYDVVKEYEAFLDFSNTDYELCYIYYLTEENVLQYLDKLHTYFASNYPGLKFHAVYVCNTLSIFFQKFKASYGKLTDIYIEKQMVDVEYKRESFPNLLTLLDSLLIRLKRYEIVLLWDNNRHIPIYNHDALFQNMNRLVKSIGESDGNERTFYLKEINGLLDSSNELELVKALTSNMILKLSVTMNIPQKSMHLTEFFKEIENCEYICAVQEMAINKLNSLLAAPSQKAKKYKDFIEKTLQYVNDHISNPNISLKWIAENLLFMNVDYLSKQFVKQTGYKFSHYLTNARMEKAKLLLSEEGSEKIYIVAEQVGCGNNPQYFSQIFKKHTGLTPTAYIKKLTEDNT